MAFDIAQSYHRSMMADITGFELFLVVAIGLVWPTGRPVCSFYLFHYAHRDPRFTDRTWMSICVSQALESFLWALGVNPSSHWLVVLWKALWLAATAAFCGLVFVLLVIHVFEARGAEWKRRLLALAEACAASLQAFHAQFSLKFERGLERGTTAARQASQTLFGGMRRARTPEPQPHVSSAQRHESYASRYERELAEAIERSRRESNRAEGHPPVPAPAEPEELRYILVPPAPPTQPTSTSASSRRIWPWGRSAGGRAPRPTLSTQLSSGRIGVDFNVRYVPPQLFILSLVADRSH